MAWSQSGNIRGASGTPGASGASGVQGASGVPGASGTPGASGASGPIGATGPAGTTTWAGITDKPGAILNYKGTWNASTNSPTLSDSTGSGGDVYRVSVGGTRNLGSGSIVWDSSDYAIYSPVTSSWEKADTTDAVSSVNTRTGAITLSYLDLGASGTPSASNFLRGDGSWAAGPIGATGATGASGGTGGTGLTGPGFYRDIATITTPTTLGASGNTDYMRLLSTGSDDANFTSVTALLLGDGSNNATTIVDSSALAANWTASGNAKLSTSVKKFGTASISFDGTNSYIAPSAAASNYTFSTSAFTLEFWVYFNSLSGTQVVADWRTTQGAFPTIYQSSNTLKYFVNSADRITSGSISATTWYHVALCRSGTSTKMFIDGTQAGSTYTDSTDYSVGTGRPWFGAAFDGAYFNGYLDDIRITKGVARYTANFTAPTAALPVGTVGTPTLPAAATASTNKSFYYFRNISPGAITVGASGSQAINGATGGLSLASNSTAHLVSDGTGWYTL